MRWLGAAFIVLGGASAGFSLSANMKKTERMIRALLYALKIMRSEIEFRLTPIKYICKKVSSISGQKDVSDIFFKIYAAMEKDPHSSAEQHIAQAISHKSLSPNTKRAFCELFYCLGKQDVCAQVRMIIATERTLYEDLEELQETKKDWLRTYRVLGLCLAVAVVIILI